MRYLLTLVLMLNVGCITTEVAKGRDHKRVEVLACIKELTTEETSAKDAFEVCRQIYDLKAKSLDKK